MITLAYLALALAGAGFGARMLLGPTMADRIVAVNGIVVAGMGAIVARAVETGVGAFLPVVVVFALVGFVGTGMVARYMEHRGR